GWIFPSPSKSFIYYPVNIFLVSMLSSHRERGLSEIVGFILILAAIVIAVALYATFGIPAQGGRARSPT
ncbi:MAG: hypothetical protein LUQ60_01560, partial [Methanomicrobiales archaeon]|nr:hypothetical protein [Methanomicrobiales archaeon]